MAGESASGMEEGALPAARMPLRQIHLDFHTPPEIPDVGADFDAEAFAATLRGAHVQSINLFAKCHHGFSYHDTAVGRRHPGLKYDLLRAQYEACRKAGIGVQIYVSAGWDELMTHLHPEWRKLGPEGEVISFNGRPFEGGWLEVCFNTPYLDHLCDQIREVVTLFPDCDGIWLDILHQDPCYCPRCTDAILAAGGDPTDPAAAARQFRATRELYFRRTVAAARSLRPDMPVFHNMGHAPRGDRGIFRWYSHLELESLPTGGWGYDHFPQSAAFAQTLGKAYLGMTGRFNTLWGEFGGVKHPNALRYECAAISAWGGAVSIGDHLPPRGRLDPDAYAAIGTAFAEMAAKADWLGPGAIRADIAIYSRAGQANPGLSQGEARHDPIDSAAARMLLEAGHPFHLIDTPELVPGYRLVIFPDEIVFDDALVAAVAELRARGGRVLLSGASGFDATGRDRIDTGSERLGPGPFDPDFAGLAELTGQLSPVVIYGGSMRLRPRGGRVLAWIHEPHLQRHGRVHYGHLHAPPRAEPSPYAAVIEHDGVVTLAHRLFSSYGGSGAVSQRRLLEALLDRLLPGPRLVRTGLPSTGRASVLRQAEKGRDILHLLYAPLASRGRFKGRPIEVIEDIPVLHDIAVELRPDAEVAAVTLVPQGEALPYSLRDGLLCFRVPRLDCHQMVEIRHRSAA